jgi:hypothetical protein
MVLQVPVLIAGQYFLIKKKNLKHLFPEEKKKGTCSVKRLPCLT